MALKAIDVVEAARKVLGAWYRPSLVVYYRRSAEFKSLLDPLSHNGESTAIERRSQARSRYALQNQR